MGNLICLLLPFTCTTPAPIAAPRPITIPVKPPVAVPVAIPVYPTPVNLPTPTPPVAATPPQTPVTLPAPTPVTVPVIPPVVIPAATPVSIPATTPVSIPAPPPVSIPARTPVVLPVPTPVVIPTGPTLSNVSFVLGIVTHSTQPQNLTSVQVLKPRLVRVGHLNASRSRTDIQELAEDYAKYGARMVPSIDFNVPPPSDADSANVGTWATIPNIEAIEFGNEPWAAKKVKANYTEYAHAFKIAYDAVYAANPNMTLIAVTDPGDALEPRVGLLAMQELQKVGVKPRAVQFHAYGYYVPDKLARCKKDLAEMGWSDISIWVTEVGIASNGNWPVVGDNPPWGNFVSFDFAAKFIENSTEILRQGGVSRVFLFKGYDSAPNFALRDAQYYFGLTDVNVQQKGALTPKAQELLAKYYG